MYFGFLNFGAPEIVILLLIILVIFGPKKLPDIGKAFGEMLANFRSGTQNGGEKPGPEESKDKDKHNH